MAARVHGAAAVGQVHAGPDVGGDLSEVAVLVGECGARLPDGVSVADLSAPDVVAQDVDGHFHGESAGVGLFEFVCLRRADGKSEARRGD